MIQEKILKFHWQMFAFNTFNNTYRIVYLSTDVSLILWVNTSFQHFKYSSMIFVLINFQ